MCKLYAFSCVVRVFVRFARFSFRFGVIVPKYKNNALNAKIRIKFACISFFS